MIDYCTSKRIFSFVIALIIFSALIFVVEEYAEENEAVDMNFKKQQKQTSEGVTKETATHSSNDCWLNEPYTVLKKCLPCSDFEVRAIKAKHCLPTGFFERLNCSTSGVLALRPCQSKKSASQSTFYWFTTANVVIFAISYVAAMKRKEHLEGYAYMRVAQQFE